MTHNRKSKQIARLRKKAKSAKFEMQRAYKEGDSKRAANLYRIAAELDKECEKSVRRRRASTNGNGFYDEGQDILARLTKKQDAHNASIADKIANLWNE